MPFVPLIVGLGAGLMLAFAISGFMYKFLTDAQKAENGILPFLLLFWLIAIALFSVLFPLVIAGRLF